MYYGTKFSETVEQISGAAFGLWNWRKLHAESPPVFQGSLWPGLWPRLMGPGTFRFGEKVCFKAIRMRQCLTVFEGATLDIGSRTFLNDGVNIYAATEVTIGEDSKLADMVYIFDTDFHDIGPGEPIRKKPVHIGKSVWLGAKTIVLAGAEIGDYAVVGAGSVVTGRIPPRTVSAGNPARVIRNLDVPDGWARF